MDLKNKRKHYVKIDRDTTSQQGLALLNSFESDEKNGPDTEFIMEDETADEKDEKDSNDGGDLLAPDTSVHIASVENWEVKTKKAKKIKGKEKEIPLFTWKKRANQHEREEFTLKVEVMIEEMQEHCTPFHVFWKVNNLDELINLILVESNFYAQQNDC